MDPELCNVIDLACLLSGLAIASYWDLRTMRIPRLIPLMLVGVWMVHQGVVGLYETESERSLWIADGLEAIAAAVLMAGLLSLIRWCMNRPSGPGGLGVGDVKLMTCVALYLGWSSSLGVLFFSCCYALVLAVLLPRIGWGQPRPEAAPAVASHAGTALSVVPFAPAILLGVVTVVPL